MSSVGGEPWRIDSFLDSSFPLSCKVVVDERRGSAEVWSWHLRPFADFLSSSSSPLWSERTSFVLTFESLVSR